MASVTKKGRENYVPRKQVEEFRYNLMMTLVKQPESVQAEFAAVVDEIERLLG